MLCCFNICAAFSGIPYTYVYVWPINNYGLWWQMFMQRSYKCIKINWLKKSEVSGYCGLIAGWYLSTDGFTYWSASSSPVCGEKFHFLLYTEGIMFYLCYILVYFFSLLALTSDEYFMSSWCNFNILWLDSLLRSTFSGRWGNCSKFRQKFDSVLIRRLVITNVATCEIREILFQQRDNRATFWCKIRSCFRLPIFDEPWQTRCTTWSSARSLILLSFARWRRCQAATWQASSAYWADSHLLCSIMQHQLSGCFIR